MSSYLKTLRALGATQEQINVLLMQSGDTSFTESTAEFNGVRTGASPGLNAKEQSVRAALGNIDSGSNVYMSLGNNTGMPDPGEVSGKGANRGGVVDRNAALREARADATLHAANLEADIKNHSGVKHLDQPKPNLELKKDKEDDEVNYDPIDTAAEAAEANKHFSLKSG